MAASKPCKRCGFAPSLHIVGFCMPGAAEQKEREEKMDQDTELEERLEQVETALDLLRKAVAELETALTVETVKDADHAMNEAEEFTRGALKEMEGWALK